MIHMVLLFLALQTGAEAAPQHEKAGVAALKAGQVDSAIEEFKMLTEVSPQNAEGFYELGVAYIQSKNFAEAIPPLRNAVQLNPGLVAARESLGYALLYQGYATEAVTQFQAAANDPAGLGIAQMETGDLVNAVHNLQDAVNQHPGNADLLYYLARASGLLSKQLYDMLLNNFPNSPRSHQAKAEFYSAVHQLQKAADEYQEVLRHQPDLFDVWLSLGDVYASANLWKQAEDAFREEIKLQPGNAEAAYGLGKALLQDGDVHGAREQLERANHLQPDMPETLSALGKAESQDGNDAGAETAWRRLIELEKTGELASQAHYGLAGVYRKQGKVQEAAEEMKAFQAARPAQKEQ